MRLGRPVVVVAVAGLVWAGCASTSAPTTTFEARESTLDQDREHGLDACNSSDAHGLVLEFLTSYNEGRGGGAPLTELYFAPADRFQWFSDQELGTDEAVRDLDGLDAYFAERFESGDRLTLIDFEFNGYRETDDTGHFGMSLRRGDRTLIQGKGAIDCESSRIMVWSIGSDS